MEVKGRLKDVARDFFSGKWKMTFEVDSLPDTDELSGFDLRLIAKKWREKRSLNANSYFHSLVGQIAEHQGISTTECKNIILSRWGYPELTEDGNIMTMCIDDEIDWAELDWVHLRPDPSFPTMFVRDKLYRDYAIIRGSHTYDTKEMSHLIDGVVRQAKMLGIETMTPNELASLMSKWSPKEEKELKNAG